MHLVLQHQLLGSGVTCDSHNAQNCWCCALACALIGIASAGALSKLCIAANAANCIATVAIASHLHPALLNLCRRLHKTADQHTSHTGAWLPAACETDAATAFWARSITWQDCTLPFHCTATLTLKALPAWLIAVTHLQSPNRCQIHNPLRHLHIVSGTSSVTQPQHRNSDKAL